jgi:hypothetical protein
VDVGYVPLYFAVVDSVNNGLGSLILLVQSSRIPSAVASEPDAAQALRRIGDRKGRRRGMKFAVMVEPWGSAS